MDRIKFDKPRTFYRAGDKIVVDGEECEVISAYIEGDYGTIRYNNKGYIEEYTYSVEAFDKIL